MMALRGLKRVVAHVGSRNKIVMADAGSREQNAQKSGILEWLYHVKLEAPPHGKVLIQMLHL